MCANSQHAVLYLLLFVALLTKSDISHISLTGRTPVQGEHRHRSSRKSGGRRPGRGDQSSAHEIHRSHGSPSRIGTRCTTRMWPLQPHQIKASWCNCHKSYCRDLELWIIMTYYDICQLLVAVSWSQTAILWWCFAAQLWSQENLWKKSADPASQLLRFLKAHHFVKLSQDESRYGAIPWEHLQQSRCRSLWGGRSTRVVCIPGVPGVPPWHSVWVGVLPRLA